MDPTVGRFAGSIVELTDVLTLDIHIPTEDVLLPTEDIPPASDNILVRFTVGICRRTAEQRDELHFRPIRPVLPATRCPLCPRRLDTTERVMNHGENIAGPQRRP
jgi:hypothetical protein